MRNIRYHTQVTGRLIYCYSEMADYEYYIRLEDFTGDENFTGDLNELLDIIEHELSLWGAPEDALEECPDKYLYYYHAGYVEIVQDKLAELGIAATYFVKMEDEEE